MSVMSVMSVTLRAELRDHCCITANYRGCREERTRPKDRPKADNIGTNDCDLQN